MNITSTQNPLIKKIALLSEKSRERKKQGLCVVEGVREIRLALQGGYSLENLLYQPDIFSERQLNELLSYTTQKLTPIAISKEVYEKISYRSSTEGVIALIASKPYYEVSFSEASAIVVGTEDQGLTDEWLRHSTQNIIIPMEGVIDSMNVSVAAAVLIFEAKRQRVMTNNE